MRRIAWIVFGLVTALALAWGAAALHFAGPRPPLVANGLAAAFLLAGLGMLIGVRPLRRTLVALVVLFGIFALWWRSLEPRNDRDWQPDVARPSRVEITGDLLTVHDLRNFDHRSETDYTPRWETRTFNLARLSGLDLFLSYWGSPLIAHTIMSWDFGDGQHLAISIETRKEKGEEYSAVAGFFRQYELYFVVADERDVVRLRTNFRGEDVYVYRLDAPPADARVLLLRYIQAVNELHERPQWYNALTENCTTAIQRLAASGERRSWWSWKLFLNGYLDELAYDIGAIDRSMPFAVLKAKSHVNERAKPANDDPRFSVQIREGLPRMSLDPGSAGGTR
jgi:hypothetical protein